MDKVIEACRPAGGILEIGPGPGVLTQRLVQLAPTIAIDIDSRVEPALAEAAAGALLVVDDVLRVDVAQLLGELPEPRVIVSNVPYYITAPIVERVCESARLIGHAVLMMQEEVARRLEAKPGDSARGSLSVFVQSHFTITTIANVPAGAFYPPPKVDSRVLKLVPNPIQISDGFFPFVRAGFKQPRKTLTNNLIAVGIERKVAEAALKDTGLSAQVRPHFLSLGEWLRVAERVRSPKN